MTTFQDVEKARIKYRNKIIKYIILIPSVEICILLFVLFCTKIANYENLFETAPVFAYGILILTTIVIISVTITFIKNRSKEYKKIYKAYFVNKTASQTFTNLYFDHENGIEKKILDDTLMIDTGDRYSSNDLMIGKYKNKTFTQADVKIEKLTSAGDDKYYYRKIFNGRFMIFEFPKKFSYSLEVVSNFFEAKKIPENNPKTGRKFERFRVESPTFNKKFKIYAEDGFETFYLMDPTIIEKIEKLSVKYKKRMIMCFVDNKLYIGINNNKDSFEPPCPFRKIDEQTEINNNLQRLKLTTDFIDGLF